MNMNMMEWEGSSVDQQRELIARWYKSGQWDAYENMARRAAAVLKKELASIPEITNVSLGGGETVVIDGTTRVIELVLDVYTLLPESNRLEKLPVKFVGFSVQQINLGDKRDAFHRTWKRLFRELKGWSENETSRWAEKWEDSLSGRQPSAIYHYGPVKLALNGLIDKSVKQAAGDRLRLLERDLVLLIVHPKGGESPANLHPDAVEDYDWEHVRRRFGELVNEYSKPR